MTTKSVGEGGLSGPVWGAIMAAIVGVGGFLASDFIDGRDNDFAALETRLSNDFAELKKELSARFDRVVTSTSGDIDDIGRRVSILEARESINRTRIQDLTRRADVQAEILRERTLDKME